MCFPEKKKPRTCEAVDSGGGKGVRTPGLRLAKPALSQLSYTPFRNKHPSGDSALAGVFIAKEMVDLTRFELVTSRLSAGRSNQLSYRSIALGDNNPAMSARQPLFSNDFASLDESLGTGSIDSVRQTNPTPMTH